MPACCDSGVRRSHSRLLVFVVGEKRALSKRFKVPGGWVVQDQQRSVYVIWVVWTCIHSSLFCLLCFALSCVSNLDWNCFLLLLQICSGSRARNEPAKGCAPDLDRLDTKAARKQAARFNTAYRRIKATCMECGRRLGAESTKAPVAG